MLRVKDIREQFNKKIEDEDYVIDKTSVKTVEIVGASFIADDYIFRSPNEAYIQKELDWYKSQSLNIYDMPNPPKIWRAISDKDGYVNSNYGWCVYSEDNGDQYKNVIRELRKNKDSRRACMIYTRPSMHIDYNKDGMSDFMCTSSVQILIRDNRLHYVINQRSCDAIFGYLNDWRWHKYIQEELVKDLQEDFTSLDYGNIYYQTGSIHIYERHFKFIK